MDSGVKVLFSPRQDTSDSTLSLPTGSLYESDVREEGELRGPIFKFLRLFILGQNEKLKFLMGQKTACGRWGPCLIILDFIYSVTGVFMGDNFISGLMILGLLIVLRPWSALISFISFFVSWLLLRLLHLPKGLLSSSFLLGLHLPLSPPPSHLLFPLI